MSNYGTSPQRCREFFSTRFLGRLGSFFVFYHSVSNRWTVSFLSEVATAFHSHERRERSPQRYSRNYNYGDVFATWRQNEKRQWGGSQLQWRHPRQVLSSTASAALVDDEVGQDDLLSDNRTPIYDKVATLPMEHQPINHTLPFDLNPLEELQCFTSDRTPPPPHTILLPSKTTQSTAADESFVPPFFATVVPNELYDTDDLQSPPPIVFDDLTILKHQNSNHDHDDASLTKKQRLWWRFFRREQNGIDQPEGANKNPTGKRRKHRARELSSLLARTASNSTAGRQYAARTITGLINALAEEVSDLDVQVHVDEDTPLHEKHIQSVKIEFSRLGFKPLWLGGHHVVDRSPPKQNDTLEASIEAQVLGEGGRNDTSVTADEAFDRMDVDKSGFIDYDELLKTLSMIAARSAGMKNATAKGQILPILQSLASDLFRLYDQNGDGVVDRKEYKSMVNDMAALARQSDPQGRSVRAEEQNPKMDGAETIRYALAPFRALLDRFRMRDNAEKDGWNTQIPRVSNETKGEARMKRADSSYESLSSLEEVDASSELVESVQKSIGSIVFSDIKMDLRRLVFGAIPLLKRILPGGPLILEPFTTTITGSFNREEIMKSVLLDAGLRRLVMRTLRKRVGFFRDFMEGSVFRGRSWKTFGGEGPTVEVPKLTNVEFDHNDKLIVTGCAKVKTHPDSPVIEQAFKLRTRIGTRKDGRFIRLEEPELALVLECPRSWDIGINSFCSVFGIDKPPRPQPIYSFFPIYSPFKLQDDDGFDLGADNSIKSLYIKDGALRFEMSAILRPGRFLGSHYIAFSTPIRTVIVTLDRVAEGMRAARRVKKAQNTASRTGRFLFLGRLEDAIMNRQDRRLKANKPKRKGFFSRFLDGYCNADTGEADKERVTMAIREFFGRQGS